MSNTNDEKTVEETVKEVEVKDTPETEAPEATQEEKTIEDAVVETKPESESVPLAKFMGEKKKRQDLEARIKEIEESPTESVTSASLSELADDLGVDIEAAKKIAATVKSEVMSDIEPRFAEIDAEKKAKNEKKVLNDLFKTAIDKNPDYKEVVDKETIIKLAKISENRGKTMSEIIKQTYGRVSQDETSPKTMETNKGSDKSPKKVDFDKLSKMDDETQLEVLRDPENRKAYNEYLEGILSI